MSQRLFWLFLIALPLIFFAGWLSHSSFSPTQTSQTQPLVKTPTPSLELQQQCAARADQFFKYQTGAAASNSNFSYQDHFNNRPQKCFVLLTHGIGIGVDAYYGEDLYDAYEQKS